MTEKEFLEKRQPFWLAGEDLEIVMPTNSDKHDMHAHLCKKYHYSWMHCIRGYWMPEEHFAVLYVGDYETPNCTILVVQYLLNYFPEIEWVGLGCYKGKKGDIWEPKVIVKNNDIFNK